MRLWKRKCECSLWEYSNAANIHILYCTFTRWPPTVATTELGWTPDKGKVVIESVAEPEKQVTFFSFLLCSLFDLIFDCFHFSNVNLISFEPTAYCNNRQCTHSICISCDLLVHCDFFFNCDVHRWHWLKLFSAKVDRFSGVHKKMVEGTAKAVKYAMLVANAVIFVSSFVLNIFEKFSTRTCADIVKICEFLIVIVQNQTDFIFSMKSVWFAQVEAFRVNDCRVCQTFAVQINLIWQSCSNHRPKQTIYHE